MAPPVGVLPERDPIAGLTSILDLYSGKVTQDNTEATTSTSTNTKTDVSSTRSNLTTEQLNNQIDMAMAPLNQAAHGAGLSTYGDTTLALGRGQISADILAKNAGTTTTNTSTNTNTATNPGTKRTVTTPGPLAPSRFGGTLQSLAITQLGAPFAKKLADKVGITAGGKSIVDTVLDALFSTAATATGAADVASYSHEGLNYANPLTEAIPYSNEGLNYAANAAGESPDLGDGIWSNVGSEVGSNFAGEAASGVAEAAAPVAEAAADAGGNFFSNFFDDFWSIGGHVKAKPGYADGGSVNYLDRHVATSNLVAQSSVSPTLAALSGTPPATSVNPITAKVKKENSIESNSSSNAGGVGAPIYNALEAPGDGNGSSPSNSGTGNIGDVVGAIGNAIGSVTLGDVVSMGVNAALGIATAGMSTIGNLGLSATGHATLGQAVSNALGTGNSSIGHNSAIGPAQANTSNQAAVDQDDEDMGAAASANAAASVSTDNNAGTSAEGTSDSSGSFGGGEYSKGGAINGPGTGTSDSINAMLSDGETVITARTTEKVKQLLGDDFFLNLERQFNSGAAKAQVAQGRT